MREPTPRLAASRLPDNIDAVRAEINASWVPWEKRFGFLEEEPRQIPIPEEPPKPTRNAILPAHIGRQAEEYLEKRRQILDQRGEKHCPMSVEHRWKCNGKSAAGNKWILICRECGGTMRVTEAEYDHFRKANRRRPDLCPGGCPWVKDGKGRVRCHGCGKSRKMTPEEVVAA